MNGKKNQLFIHPTDQCNMKCDFCVYSQNRSDHTCRKLDIYNETAQKSLQNLLLGAQHIAFSGGGEPFLNVETIVQCIRFNRNKKYMITTGLGETIENIERKIEMINEACKETNSLCVFRISIDSFHNTISFNGTVDSVIKWFVEKRWSNVRTCFLRGVLFEKKQLLSNLKRWCRKNKFFYCSKKINKFTYGFMINKKFFQVIFRPTIYPSREQKKLEGTMLEYIDTMLEIDTEQIYLGKPRSCRGCRGCDSWKSGQESGVDITITAKGDIYLYGAELCSLGNIYSEIITYELLEKRIEEKQELKIIQSIGIRDVMQSFLKDAKLGSMVDEINYPFAVIRECMKSHPDYVYSVIENMGKQGKTE